VGFEINRRPSGKFELRIWGRFPPNWMGHLSSGLSRNDISILSGRARRDKLSWHAELEIVATSVGADLNGINYLSTSTFLTTTHENTMGLCI